MLVIFLCFSMFFNLSFAQDMAEEDLVSLVIESPKIPKEFNETERNQTGKIILKATTKVRGYQIILGDFDPAKKTKFQVHVVDMEAIPDTRGSYTLTARLFDEKSKKLINKVSYPFIEKNSYFRELERLMNELFLPVDIEKLKEPKADENKKKAPQVKLPVPPSDAEVADLNFKERIMSLKSGVDSKMKEISEKKSDADKKDSKDSEVAPIKALAVATSNASETVMAPEKPPMKHPSFNNMAPIHKAGLLYISTTTNSKNVVNDFGNKIEIDIDTSIKYAGLVYSYQRPIKQGYDHFWQSDISVAQVRSNAVVEFSPYVHANTAYGYLWRRTGLFIRGGLDADTFSFATLPVEGEGVKASNIRLVNYLVGAHWAGELFSQPLIVGADYTKAFYALSDNSDVKASDVEGTYIRFNTTIAELYFNLNLKFEYYIADYDFSKERTLTTSTQGFGIHVNYVF
jgi:hypothetical protein